VVVFILESYGREYIGAFNKDAKVPDYKKALGFFITARYDFLPMRMQMGGNRFMECPRF
jgi:hypothetical protein